MKVPFSSMSWYARPLWLYCLYGCKDIQITSCSCYWTLGNHDYQMQIKTVYSLLNPIICWYSKITLILKTDTLPFILKSWNNMVLNEKRSPPKPYLLFHCCIYFKICISLVYFCMKEGLKEETSWDCTEPSSAQTGTGTLIYFLQDLFGEFYMVNWSWYLVRLYPIKIKTN